jgi:hypothetical protein
MKNTNGGTVPSAFLHKQLDITMPVFQGINVLWKTEEKSPEFALSVVRSGRMH